jgi:hypothetical protein
MPGEKGILRALSACPARRTHFRMRPYDRLSAEALFHPETTT